MKKIFILMLIAFVAFTFLKAGAELGIGSDAYEISASDWLNGEPTTLSALHDKIVVVEFWATWCPPCRASIPHLKKMNEEFKSKNVVFISLTDEPKNKVEPFAEKAGMNWLVGMGSRTSNDYGVTGIPHAFIIKEGKVLWSGHPMAGLEEKLRELTK